MRSTLQYISEVDFLMFLLIVALVLSVTSSLLIIYKFLFVSPDGMSFREFFRYHYNSEERVRQDMEANKEDINRAVKSYIKVEMLILQDKLDNIANKINEKDE